MTLTARFWKHVEKGPGCWLWSGTLRPDGYGVLSRGAKSAGLVRSHVLSWELANGKPVPPGMFVCHRCDVRHCVNPDHLFVGSPKENQHDMMAKGRWSPPPLLRGTRNPRAKLTVHKVKRLRRLRERGACYRELAAIFGINITAVGKVCRREVWAWL
jgi:hypothetical protein